MKQSNRFQDENHLLSDFYDEVWVVCTGCSKKAIAKTNVAEKTALLYCGHCGYHKIAAASVTDNGRLKMAAHGYFGAGLWLTARFKDDLFWAFNDQHLAYLEQYIGAGLREHKDRTHFTLLEKLPKFYHEAKNRDRLLKIIGKLKNK